MTQKQRLDNIEARVTCQEKGHDWAFVEVVRSYCLYSPVYTSTHECNRCGRKSAVHGSAAKKMYKALDKTYKQLNKTK